MILPHGARALDCARVQVISPFDPTKIDTVPDISWPTVEGLTVAIQVHGVEMQACGNQVRAMLEGRCVELIVVIPRSPKSTGSLNVAG